MLRTLLIVAALLQLVAVGYGLLLLSRLRGATGAWLCLLGAMASMLAWRVFVVTGYTPPPYFNPFIAIWGSTFMVAAMFLFGREVRQRLRVEAERDVLLDSERAARVQAEQASRAKDEFLATLSHELRSPLSAILGWCTVLQQHGRGSTAEFARGLEVIERNARAQTRLVDDLLDVTRMRAGALHLERGPCLLADPVWAAVQAARPKADFKGVALDFAVDRGVPLVDADTDRLEQVATNLVVNAIKFTPPGGRVAVHVRAEGDSAVLEVADTGEGIDPAFLPHVFEPFRQADASSARRHGGLGLGLSIVSHLVRLHGGEVRADSPGLGRGATFVVRLPATHAGAGHAVALPVRDGARPAEATLRGLRVLVVDDEADVRSAVARLLEHAGADVTCLESGATIAAVLVAWRPDVLVCDLGMPGEDGYSLVRRVRALPAAEGGRIPAISLTAHARHEDRARALAAGFDEHLPKPIDLPQLLHAIRRLADAVQPGSDAPVGAGGDRIS